jgi:hypothetical protein
MRVVVFGGIPQVTGILKNRFADANVVVSAEGHEVAA